MVYIQKWTWKILNMAQTQSKNEINFYLSYILYIKLLGYAMAHMFMLKNKQ